MSKITTFALASITALTLAGCATDTDRAAGGALAGAAIAELTDGDVATGAAIGAAAGVLCDNAGVVACQ
ncbi:MAG: hypothetical protein ACU0BF_10200 [Paracoccaceae bacterium]